MHLNYNGGSSIPSHNGRQRSTTSSTFASSIPSHIGRQRSTTSSTFERIRSRMISFCCSNLSLIIRCLCILIILFLFILIIILGQLFFYTPIIFRVLNVSLIQFDLNNNNTLHYNLTVYMNVRNPNKVFGIFYDEIEVKAFYKGNRFDSVNLMPFKQGLKNTTTLHPVVFQGETVLVPTPLENKNAKLHSDYSRDKSVGSFDIRVQVLTRIRYIVSSRKYFNGSKPRFKCDLKSVPLISSNGGNGGDGDTTSTIGGFQTKECIEYHMFKPKHC